METVQALSKPITNREATAILNELGVAIVAKNVRPKPGETRSVPTLQRIVRKHGADHAREVIMMISQSENNASALDEVSIGAVSDVLLAIKRSYADLYENDIDKIFMFFDATPIATIRARYTDGLEGIVNRRSALAGMLFERVIRIFNEKQQDWLDDRRVRNG